MTFIVTNSVYNCVVLFLNVDLSWIIPRSYQLNWLLLEYRWHTDETYNPSTVRGPPTLKLSWHGWCFSWCDPELFKPCSSSVLNVDDEVHCRHITLRSAPAPITLQLPAYIDPSHYVNVATIQPRITTCNITVGMLTHHPGTNLHYITE